MELGNELKVERIRLSLKAKAIAAQIGISPQQLYNIEQVVVRSLHRNISLVIFL